MFPKICIQVALPRPGFIAYISSHCIKEREQKFDSIVLFARVMELQRPTSMGLCHGSHNETSNRTAGLV